MSGLALCLSHARTRRFSTAQREEDPITVLMGVPTMYSILLSFYETMEPAKQARARCGHASTRNAAHVVICSLLEAVAWAMRNRPGMSHETCLLALCTLESGACWVTGDCTEPAAIPYQPFVAHPRVLNMLSWVLPQ